MTDSPPDQKHFTKAVARLGESHAVVATQAIFNSNGVKIIEKGAAINLGLYERLMQHKLSAPIEDSVHSTPSVTGDILKASAQAIMRDTPFFGRMASDEKTASTLLNVIKTVPLADSMAFQLTVAHDVHPEIYRHLVRTALAATWLAMAPMVSRFDLGMAAAAGLLHDIGMLHVDPLLLQPEQQLNREQRRQLYAHPLVSTTLVARHHQYPREVVRAIAEHHEYMDGSGYPGNLTGESISQMGKILSLAQLVAAMFAPGRTAPELHLSLLLRMNTHRYDSKLAMHVVTALQPQRDVMGAEVALLGDPAGLLREIDAVLSQWPSALGLQSGLAAPRRDTLVLLASHVAQIRRALAGVGAVPDQLDQLGAEALDDIVRTELSLVTQEAAWQLRTLARETRRRWRLQADEEFPAVLQSWLDQVDALVAKVSGAAAMDATGLAAHGEDEIDI